MKVSLLQRETHRAAKIMTIHVYSAANQSFWQMPNPPTRYNLCYTKGMKTAISLPDELFRRAEAVARKLKISRSQLYAAAITEFIERRQAARITQHLNEIYSVEPAKIDPALASAQSKSIERESW